MGSLGLLSGSDDLGSSLWVEVQNVLTDVILIITLLKATN